MTGREGIVTDMATARQVTKAQGAVEAAGGLWTQASIARALGITEQAVGERWQRGTLPAPAFTLGSRRVWLGAQLPAEITNAAGV